MQTARSNNIPFWLLLIGLFLILVSRSLLTEGMFFDGVTYASISRNMAEGQGTFWNPHYTQALYPEFRQHPPFALGMEALAFKAFGDHWWVEKFYSVLMFLLSVLFIALIWKRTTNNLRWAWLPLLFWLAMPLVSWSATNNLLENTMAVFVLLSVYLMIVGYQRHHKIWLFLSAVTLLLASPKDSRDCSPWCSRFYIALSTKIANGSKDPSTACSCWLLWRCLAELCS